MTFVSFLIISSLGCLITVSVTVGSSVAFSPRVVSYVSVISLPCWTTSSVPRFKVSSSCVFVSKGLDSSLVSTVVPSIGFVSFFTISETGFGYS